MTQMAHTVEEISTFVTPRLSQLHSWNRLNTQPVEHTLTQVAITTAAATKTTTITTTTTTIIITIIVIVTKLGLYGE
jgi:hypothetical protein